MRMGRPVPLTKGHLRLDGYHYQETLRNISCCYTKQREKDWKLLLIEETMFLK
jgi:hypothetical protein